MRIKILQIIISIMFLVLSLSVFHNQIIQGERYKQLSKTNSFRIISQKGSRGRILDRTGQVISDNYLSYDVAISLAETKDINKVLYRLADILGVSLDSLKSKYKKGIISISMPVTLVNNIDRKKAIMIEELKSELPGVLIQVTPQRSYPYGKLAAHLVGHLGEIDHWRLTKLKDYGYKTKDIVGYTGIEEKYDYYLRPEEGGLQVEVDSRNRLVRVLGFKSTKNGRDIQLTIDLRIQRIAEENLGAFTGAVVILDPYTAEVLAMASSPGFYPAWFLNKTPAITTLLNDPAAPLLNRCISGLYPAGSVFKPVVATCGLQTKKIDPKKTFFCKGGFKLGRREFSCWEKHGSQNLIEAIAHSCNVFFYRLGLLLGPDRIYEYAIKFGLSRPTQIDLPAESGGFVPSPLLKRLNKFETWFDGDTVNLAIGQGDLLVTPLQIARMMMVFANGGNLLRPYVLKSVDGIDISKHQMKIMPLSLDRGVMDAIRAGLKATVEQPDGTANILKLDYVSVAGKTGTAQVPKGQPHAWFSGYFPTTKPKFVICVFLEHAGSGFNACVVTKNIIERMQEEELL